ncbi:MAG: molecular chaperone DnaJ [Bacteroides sp.]|nr:molecular chaperone DnaJ [Bacteroides sp.]
MIRELKKPAKVALCRECRGSGKKEGRVCSQCEGSGRVTVSCELRMDIRPYRPV